MKEESTILTFFVISMSSGGRLQEGWQEVPGVHKVLFAALVLHASYLAARHRFFRPAVLVLALEASWTVPCDSTDARDAQCRARSDRVSVQDSSGGLIVGCGQRPACVPH